MGLADKARQMRQRETARTKYLTDTRAFTERYLPDIKPYAWYAGAREAIERSRFVVIMAPPGSGKTRGITVVEAVKRLVLDRRTRIGLFSKSQEKAKNFMSAVAAILRNNKRLIEDFGPFLDNTCEANTEKIRILGAQDDETTPSVCNVGLSGQVESLRFNTMFMDDPIDQETAFSQVEVLKYVERMKNTFIPRLEPSGQMVIIGSRFAESDGYHWLLANPLFKGGVFVLPALDAAGVSSIPERWTAEQLRAIRDGLSQGAEGEDVSTAVWSSRYMQSPQSDSTRPLKLDWLKYTSEESEGIIVTVDPAYSTAQHADFTAFIALGKRHGSKDLILRDMWEQRISVGHAEQAKTFYDRNGAVAAFPETNNAKTLGNEMRALGMNVTEITSTANKRDLSRIGGLENWFKRPEGAGTILLHESLKGTPVLAAFKQEFIYYPNGAHDHLLDALAMAVSALTNVWTAPKEFHPVDYARLFGG